MAPVRGHEDPDRGQGSAKSEPVCSEVAARPAAHYSGRYIVRGGNTESLEGEPPKRIAISTWKSMEAPSGTISLLNTLKSLEFDTAHASHASFLLRGSFSSGHYFGLLPFSPIA